MDTVVLVHVLAGGLGLLLAPVAACARKAPGVHTVVGWGYQGCVHVMCTTTYALVAADPGLWPFVLLAVPTQAAATAAVVVRRRHRPGWLPWHVQLVLGSYVSLVTAFAVQAFGGLWSWVVPSAVGSLVVSAATARAARPQRPAVV